MKSFDEYINKLAEMCGIIPKYQDIFGKKHIAFIETKRRYPGQKIRETPIPANRKRIVK
jgi:hypothetical protein